MRARSLLVLLLTACSAGGPGPGTQHDAGSSTLDAGPDHEVDAHRFVPDAGFVACETASAFADPLPATLLLQVDTSGSMNCAATAASCAVGDPTPDPNDSRYDVFLAVPGDDLRPLGLGAADEFAESLLGFLDLPVHRYHLHIRKA